MKPDGGEPPGSLLGLAHVASCSFLASRLAPSLQFWAALGGGLALARAAAGHGVRAGYGASAAAIVQTVALIGPARVNGPLTQALNAPAMGALHRSSRAVRLGTGLAIRLAHYAVLNVLFVVLVVGGLDEYVATYDRIAGFVRVLPQGEAWAIGLTIAASLVFALFYTTVQLLVYERAFADWPAHAEPTEAAAEAVPDAAPPRARLPVAPLLVTGACWIALLAHLSWPVLAAVAGGLGVATLVTRAWRAGREVWGIGLALALGLAISAMFPAIIGAIAFEGAAERALRAALLVLSATWLRAVAGTPGMREAARRALRGARATEAARITERLESDGRLLPAARAFLDKIGSVPQKPGPLVDALVAWVAAEADGYRPPA